MPKKLIKNKPPKILSTGKYQRRKRFSYKQWKFIPSRPFKSARIKACCIQASRSGWEVRAGVPHRRRRAAIRVLRRGGLLLLLLPTLLVRCLTPDITGKRIRIESSSFRSLAHSHNLLTWRGVLMRSPRADRSVAAAAECHVHQACVLVDYCDFDVHHYSQCHRRSTVRTAHGTNDYRHWPEVEFISHSHSLPITANVLPTL